MSAATIQRATVSATFFDRRTNAESVRTLELTYDGRVVQLRGGPTGYENFIAEDRRPEHRGRDWVACFGTKGVYDRCVIDGRSLNAALASFGLEEVATDAT